MKTWISHKAAWVYLEIIQARNNENILLKTIHEGPTLGMVYGGP